MNQVLKPLKLDKDEIALWADRAAATTTASHAYSTGVFQAVPIDFVTLEVQVEHHLEPDAYVVDVLFPGHRPLTCTTRREDEQPVSCGEARPRGGSPQTKPTETSAAAPAPALIAS